MDKEGSDGYSKKERQDWREGWSGKEWFDWINRMDGEGNHGYSKEEEQDFWMAETKIPFRICAKKKGHLKNPLISGFGSAGP